MCVSLCVFVCVYVSVCGIGMDGHMGGLSMQGGSNLVHAHYAMRQSAS